MFFRVQGSKLPAKLGHALDNAAGDIVHAALESRKYAGRTPADDGKIPHIPVIGHAVVDI
jgi:hypothetical protein